MESSRFKRKGLIMPAPGKDRDYYANRATTARRLAENAADKQIATIHHEMATRYDELAKSLTGENRAAAA